MKMYLVVSAVFTSIASLVVVLPAQAVETAKSKPKEPDKGCPYGPPCWVAYQEGPITAFASAGGQQKQIQTYIARFDGFDLQYTSKLLTAAPGAAVTIRKSQDGNYTAVLSNLTKEQLLGFASSPSDVK